ncbi:MAG: hypothetical protein ACLFMP_01355 [Desulfonatronovibrionaceae bacterium]
MSAHELIPTADAIPVAWGWLYFLLLLTFVLHLLFMNVMLGSAIMALVRDAGGKDPEVSKDISTKLPYTIAFTINLGVAPFLFLQVLYGQFIYTSSVLMAGYWLTVIGLLILLYYSAYIYDFRFDKMPGTRALLIGITAVLGLIVAFLFTNNMTLMLRPEAWNEYFANRSGTILNLGDPTLWPRYLHFVTASIALAGLFQAVMAKVRRKLPDREKRMDQGMKWFSYATAVQIVIGLWFLISLPQEIMLAFMGASALNTAVFLAAVTSAILALVLGFTRRVWPAAATVVLTIALMAVTRDLVRIEFLSPYFHPSDLELTPQYSPMIVFFVVLVLGLGLVAYTLALAAKSAKED